MENPPRIVPAATPTSDGNASEVPTQSAIPPQTEQDAILAQKIVALLSSTANGCFVEMDFPSMHLKLQSAEKLCKDLRVACAGLEAENTSLKDKLMEMTQGCEEAVNRHDALAAQFNDLWGKYQLVVHERDVLAKQNSSLRHVVSLDPTDAYNQLNDKYREALDTLRRYRLAHPELGSMSHGVPGPVHSQRRHPMSMPNAMVPSQSRSRSSSSTASSSHQYIEPAPLPLPQLPSSSSAPPNYMPQTAPPTSASFPAFSNSGWPDNAPRSEWVEKPRFKPPRSESSMSPAMPSGATRSYSAPAPPSAIGASGNVSPAVVSSHTPLVDAIPAHGPIVSTVPQPVALPPKAPLSAAPPLASVPVSMPTPVDKPWFAFKPWPEAAVAGVPVLSPISRSPFMHQGPPSLMNGDGPADVPKSTSSAMQGGKTTSEADLQPELPQPSPPITQPSPTIIEAASSSLPTEGLPSGSGTEEQANNSHSPLQTNNVPLAVAQNVSASAPIVAEQAAETPQDDAMDQDQATQSEAGEDDEEEDNWADLTEDEMPGTGTIKRPVMDCLNLVFFYDDAKDTLCRLCDKRCKLNYTSENPKFSDSSSRDMVSHVKTAHPSAWEKLRKIENNGG